MAIVRKEAYYHSSNGLNDIRALLWYDDVVNPIAVVQIAHGVGEHIGRYDEFARYLVKEGFVVCGNDHLGHGKSVMSEEELGYIDEDEGYRYMISDMNTLFRIMHKRYPALPYFMFGHSMGSLCARIYCTAFGEELTGAVFCATAQLPLPAVMLEDAVDILMSKLPVFGESANIMTDIFARLTRKINKSEDKYSWLSRNTDNIERYKEDPLCGFPMKNAGTKNLVKLAIKASDPFWAEHLPSAFPVMLISGAKDPVGLNGRAVLAVADKLTEAGIVPEVIMYPGDRHEILNEDDRCNVYKDVSTWMKHVLTHN